jgi:hypothetical protein
MLSADDNENRPVGKVGQRKGKAEPGKKAESGKKAEAGKKGEPRKRKDAQAPASKKPDQLLEALQRLGSQVEETVIEPIAVPASEPVAEQADAPVVSTESPATETALPESNLREVQLIPAAIAAETTPVSLQTIADAYGNYSKKSLEQASSFVAKLAGTRSLAGAFELQTAFAREAYETFVAESKRIRDLHRELAKQRLTRLEGFVGMTRAR